MNKETKKACERLVYESVKHLRNTKRPSFDPDDTMRCIYSEPGCAFSPAIRNKECRLTADENGFCSDTIIRQHKSYLKKWAIDIDPYFSSLIQNAHDTNRCAYDFLPAFETSVRKACEDFELDFDEITKDIPT